MKSGKEIERMLDTYIQKEKAIEVDYFLKNTYNEQGEFFERK